MSAAQELSTTIGLASSCRVLGVSRASMYRQRQPRVERPRPTPPRALDETERSQVLAALNSERFADKAPATVFATLLDEGERLCSIRTMYRVLAASKQIRERRNQLRHPQYAAPQLLAKGPNEVWSWDITKLLGPAKWTYFYLYVMMDIYSRYVVGWLLAGRESQELAQALIADSCAKQHVAPGQLTIHSDRGSPMKAKPVAQLMADMGVTKSHSRPHVSNDNPFSEAHFKTLKYRPEFPVRFGCHEDARSFCRSFFSWYNTEHRHSGIALMTPEVVHYGRAGALSEHRQRVLVAAYAAHPERFVHGLPLPPRLPEAAWINPPRQLTFPAPEAPLVAPVCPWPAAITSWGAQARSSATQVVQRTFDAGEHAGMLCAPTGVGSVERELGTVI